MDGSSADNIMCRVASAAGPVSMTKSSGFCAIRNDKLSRRRVEILFRPGPAQLLRLMTVMFMSRVAIVVGCARGMTCRQVAAAAAEAQQQRN